MDLFKQTCLKCSKVVTEAYSTSFTLGIKTLDAKFHFPIYAIYGFVRCADEIVDTFHEYDKQALLQEFKEQTYKAIETGISLNPVLHAFQCVVNEYKIDHAYIEAFLRSMEMDLEEQQYDHQLYDDYIYGSAEVVGLMCLKVFCEGDNEMFKRLKKPACSLGSAFQKVNFLRDMQSDYLERGRVYFPKVEFTQFNNISKAEIEADICQDFEDAYKGIMELPRTARLGVYLAYKYYMKLFRKIQNLPATHILKQRVRVPDNTKLALLVSSYLRYRLNAI
ncbi:phytoene/squalene synthase family protein [Pontibacter sp. KCTC 32443]|uniref:phytoene/squalene synthase family protein n=1 Tax=Pontibacter TaxID=323449 RepID=UPI00164E04B7|nr:MULTISPECIES: phytoene/squalene synthase family protein [Pontibacter]MBC5775023.1 phytoene/squalene synthase family protein [Pontibacter sp. KCTC 32443]